jgi:hypothetical protein
MSTQETQNLIPRFGFTKNPTLSLRGSQRTESLLRSHKDNLELLTITKTGNTNFLWLTTLSGSSRITSNRVRA